MEFGSTFVLCAPDEFESVADVAGPSNHARTGSFSSLRRRLRALSNAGSNNDSCIVNLFDTYSFGRLGTFSFESLPDAVGGERAKWRQQCVRDSDAFLLVYDITSKESLEAIDGFYEECCKMHGTINVPAVLCANVSDLLEDEAVPYAYALSWGRTRKVPVLRTSARSGLNVEAAFVQLVRLARRRGRNCQITILGAPGTGKTSMAVRFCYPDVVMDDIDTHDEITYTREIVVPGLGSTSTSAPQRSSSVKRSASNGADAGAPGKLRKKQRSLSVSASRSSTSLCPPGLGFSTSRKSLSIVPPLPSPAASKTSFDTKQTASGLDHLHADETMPLPTRSCTRKADCNIVSLNLGTLAPDDSNVLKVHALPGPPPTCPTCSARCRGGKRCAFCGAPVSAFAETQAPPPVEEYPIEQRYVTITWALPPAPSVQDDIGLTLFCVDVSAAMAEPHEMRYEHHLWRQAHGRKAQSSISRLECLQDAVLLHLERIHKYHPHRRVGLLLVTGDVECTFGGTYARHRVKDGYIRSLKQGANYGDSLVSPYWKELSNDNVYSEFGREVRHLRPRDGTERAMGTAMAIALGLARGNARETGTQSEIFVCTTGSCNVGVGSTQAVFAGTGPEYGREFYQRAGELAQECSAIINVVGITREDPALEIVSVSARTCGGLVTVMDEPKLHREPKRADRRRVIARNAVAQLFLPRGCRFAYDVDPRPTVAIDVDATIATINLPEVDDDSDLSFAFFGPHDAGDALPFQAQIQYTNGAGDTMVRILHTTVPVTRSRAQSEVGANIPLVASHALRITAARAAALLRNDDLDYARSLRDDLRAFRRLLQRTKGREGTPKFDSLCEQLDCQLEAAFEGPLHLVGASRELSTTGFLRMAELRRSILAPARGRSASNARRTDRWI
ncbi:hypothetical protein EXIGLDRAFT_764779 [Exidia glandulosa HHB12029]|uniref:Uncharacterized protein n=1 Tax=Exidia glandulosa HHB12029 TaxID=1314781 RepID=A0A165KX07_EXIGL|nr:hypothetical protein EXIGLDRAFT_764779 [Exidia glandulosa HHB12029]